MAFGKIAQIYVARFLRNTGGCPLVEFVMRRLLNRSRIRMLLLALVATVSIPTAGATAAQASRKAAISAYNRPSAIAMSQFGADSTALNAQDIVIPLLARLDAPVLSEVSWTVATVSSVGDGSPTVNPAPLPAASSNAAGSRLPRSSPAAAMVATMMLIAFFLFRRAQ